MTEDQLPPLPEPAIQQADYGDGGWNECRNIASARLDGCATQFAFTADQMREYARAALAAREGWRPIETAPKDQTNVLIANDSVGSIHPREAYYVRPEHRYPNEPTHEGWWRLAGSSETAVRGRTPTHWQPLPAPPADAGTTSEVTTNG